MSHSIEDRIERLERRQTWLLAGIALTGFVALWLVSKTTLNPKAEQPSALRTKQLEIIDSGGVARLRLGAPLPDATLDGEILPRRSPASGIQLNDAKGDEVGGMGMLDDGTMLLCFDWNGAEASCMYVMPTGEHGLWVGDVTGKDRARVMVTADNQTKVILNGGTLKNQVLFLVGSNGATLLEAHDGDGRTAWKAHSDH
jgi:hypothetical protein